MFEGEPLTSLVNGCWRGRDLLECSLGTKTLVGIIFLSLPFYLAGLVGAIYDTCYLLC